MYDKDGYWLTIPTPPRTKKNHGQLVTLKTGRQMMLPSKAYVAFEKEVVKFVKEHFPDFEAINEPVSLKCLFYKDKNYKADLVGYLQAIQDALVKAKFLADDNHKIIVSVDGSRVLLDRENPRVEVIINYLGEQNESSN